MEALDLGGGGGGLALRVLRLLFVSSGGMRAWRASGFRILGFGAWSSVFGGVWEGSEFA